MIPRLRLKWTSKLGLALVLGATTVLAQPAPETGGADAEVGFRKGSQLTSQEQLSQAETYITKMKSLLRSMERLADQARKDKDIIKLNCVNDKIIQAKGNLNLAEQSRDALKVASARGDDGTRNHEFAKLTITYQKVVVLGQEAEACIGEEISYVGATKVEIEVDKDIPQEDPTVTPPAPLPVARPPIASPYR
jgi:hypothetical protein